MLIGLAAGRAAIDYGIGTPSEAEPGFFPLILSVLIGLCGIGVTAGSVDLSGRAHRRQGLRLDGWHLWCLAVVASGFVIFGALLPIAGLFVTCVVSITVVGAGSRLLTPVGALLTATILGGVAVVLFRYLLDLQIPAWPWGG